MTEPRKTRVPNRSLDAFLAGGDLYPEWHDALLDLRDERRQVAELEGQVAALRDALHQLDGGDEVTVVGDLKALLADTTAAAREYRERIRRETLEEAAIKAGARIPNRGTISSEMREWRPSEVQNIIAARIRALATEPTP